MNYNWLGIILEKKEYKSNRADKYIYGSYEVVWGCSEWIWEVQFIRNCFTEEW